MINVTVRGGWKYTEVDNKYAFRRRCREPDRVPAGYPIEVLEGLFTSEGDDWGRDAFRYVIEKSEGVVKLEGRKFDPELLHQVLRRFRLPMVKVKISPYKSFGKINVSTKHLQAVLVGMK